MSVQTGPQIRKARTAAGMTQKELAEAVDGLSAKSISEAERGLRELTDEELAAIAEVTGSDSLLLCVGKSESPAAPAETGAPADTAVPEETAAPEEAAETEENTAPAEAVTLPNIGEVDILNLFNAAAPAVKEAAASVLKSGTPQGKEAIDDVLPTVVEMLGSDKGGNPLVTIVGFLASEKGQAFLVTLKGVLSNVSGMFSRDGATDDMSQDMRKETGSLLLFTFFYSVAIYVLLLSFYFWLIRTDIEPKDSAFSAS